MRLCNHELVCVLGSGYGADRQDRVPKYVPNCANVRSFRDIFCAHKWLRYAKMMGLGLTFKPQAAGSIPAGRIFWEACSNRGG
jgi:hypothetical protein